MQLVHGYFKVAINCESWQCPGKESVLLYSQGSVVVPPFLTISGYFKHINSLRYLGTAIIIIVHMQLFTVVGRMELGHTVDLCQSILPLLRYISLANTKWTSAS